MEDTLQRSRYPRYSATSRKRKRNARENSSLAITIIRQIFFSVLILLVIIIIKNINAPITNYLSQNVQKAISDDIELKGLYEGIRDIFKHIEKGEMLNADETGFDEEAVPASGEISALESIDVEGLDGNYCLGEEFITPLNGVLGSGFGDRIHPIKNTVEFHHGIDIEAKSGDMIKAALSGVVVEVDSQPSYGKYVKVWHSPGLETVYAHCSSLAVKKGQKVKQGDIISEVGDTGTGVGTHLHFEIWKDGQPVNPTNYISLSES